LNTIHKKVVFENLYILKKFFFVRYIVTTLARYSRYIFYGGICSTKHDYLHARHASERARRARQRAERAVLDALASELDVLDSEHGEQEEISFDI
jgi:hypothetical protein